MGEMCADNRFELIEKYKKKLIENTNIQTSEKEMEVLDSILFRFWQMGWLDKEWIPVNEIPPKKDKLVLVSTDMMSVLPATYNGNYWTSHFDLDWEEILAWKPYPKPYRGGE